MADYPTNIRNLLREFAASPDVHRVGGDDDGIANYALMRPTTPLTKAVAALLMGAGFVRPHGDGVYVVTWSDHA